MDSNKETDYKWIIRAIASCHNEFHTDGCKALIELFYQKHNDGDMAQELHRENSRQQDYIKILSTKGI